MNAPAHIETVLTALWEAGFEAHPVGGCVRDRLLGREPADWDICTSARPEQTKAVFRDFRCIETGLKHGTLTVLSGGRPVEITTYRTESGYADNRHPDGVEFVTSLADDLSRRDFTINAMAYSPTRGLVDAFDGRQDLAAGLIRCVGEADARFNEDGLRLLRALRFASRFGFGIERETAFAIHRNRHLLENVSAERIFKELKGILAGEGIAQMMLAFPDVFSVIIPELAPCIGFQQCNPHHCYDVWTHLAHAVQAAPAGDDVLRLTLLLHDVQKPACFRMGEDGRGHFRGHAAAGAEVARTVLRRLKSDNATMEDVVALVRVHDDAMPTTPAGMRRLVGRLGLQNVQRLLLVKRADCTAQSSYKQEEKFRLLRESHLLLEEVLEAAPAFTIKDLSINGRDLMQLGMQPGPAMRNILERLLAEVQEETLPNTRDALLPQARKYLSADESSL